MNASMGKYAIPVPANGELIRWARLSSHLSQGAAVSAFKLSRLDDARLKAIETKETDATISEVLEFARVYRRPFSFFFLPKAPPPIPELPDNRTGTGHGTDTDGDLSLAIARAYEVHELIAELTV